MKARVCVHGHFYQPPRENPWLEVVEREDSAYPYHDWNERIAAECYLPNATARILDPEGWIEDIVDNYDRISFNMGPTLLKWLEDDAPDVYERILESDRASLQRFGHGAALAQPYNHMILPLASRRDKTTQVRWGIEDFRHRFDRDPEGMWLPEAAADLPTLEVLAEHGIRFTILSPAQARRVRRPGGEWRSARDLDTTVPYRCRLPSGNEITLFFYDGLLAQEVAFDGILNDGKRFADRLRHIVPKDAPGPRLAHIATDGETYGHHHRHAEMALAYALRTIERSSDAELAIYGCFLDEAPIEAEVEIHEPSSWSCAHGVERWRSDCGCSTGGRSGWRQAWRKPLRDALDSLRARVNEVYEAKAEGLLKDPWRARDDYIRFILDRSDEVLADFMQSHALRTGREAEVKVLKLLEMQRHSMLMYTSCGWFFSDISGIETVQVIRYAARALQLAEEFSGEHLEDGFVGALAKAPSNVPQHKDGAGVFRNLVAPEAVDLHWVAGHYALSSLFREYGERDRFYCFLAERLDEWRRTAGRARLLVGRVRISSVITRESGEYSYAVVHLGDQNLHGGIRACRDDADHARLSERMQDAFASMDVVRMLRCIDEESEGRTYDLPSLFRDEKLRILNEILEETLANVEAVYAQVYDQHAPLMRFLSTVSPRLPRPLATTAAFVLRTRLRRAMSPEPDLDQVEELLAETRQEHLELDGEGAALEMQEMLERLTDAWRDAPWDADRLDLVLRATTIAESAPFHVELRPIETQVFAMARTALPEMQRQAGRGLASAQRWISSFHVLAERLRIRVPS